MGSCVATYQVNRRQCENPFGASNIGSTKQNKTEFNLSELDSNLDPS